MSKPMKRMLLIVGIVFTLIFGWYGAKKGIFYYYMSHYKPAAVSVLATKATSETWQSYLESVGTLTAVMGVEISPEVAGLVKEMRFESGQFVKKGDLLVLLESSVEEAILKDNLAQLKLMQINFERDQTLLKKNAISQSTVDATNARLQQAEAAVQQTQALLKQKTILAPFSGKIGIRQINIGEYLSAGTTIVTLQTIDPLLVRFNLPEQYVNEIYLKQPIDISVNLSGGKTIRGEITAINAKVDQTTRNILIEATIPNKDLQLYPGMYAGVKIWLKAKNNVVTLPQTAISYSLHGDSVYIIKSEKDENGESILKASRQYVTVGERRGDQVAILENVSAGDLVVTSGQVKLQNGTLVDIATNVEL